MNYAGCVSVYVIYPCHGSIVDFSLYHSHLSIQIVAKYSCSFLPAVQVRFAGSTFTVTEGSLELTEVCVELQGDLGISITVNINFAEDTASFQDFTNMNTNFTFSSTSSNPQCLELDIISDDLLESEERFNIELSSPDSGVVEIVGGNAEVIVLDSSELVVGFVSPNGTVTEGGMFSACVRIFSGGLAEQFILPLTIEVSAGQGEEDMQ